MQKQIVLTEVLLRRHRLVVEDLESGVLEQDLGIVQVDTETQEDSKDKKAV